LGGKKRRQTTGKGSGPERLWALRTPCGIQVCNEWFFLASPHDFGGPGQHNGGEGKGRKKKRRKAKVPCRTTNVPCLVVGTCG